MGGIRSYSILCDLFLFKEISATGLIFSPVTNSESRQFSLFSFTENGWVFHLDKASCVSHLPAENCKQENSAHWRTGAVSVDQNSLQRLMVSALNFQSQRYICVKEDGWSLHLALCYRLLINRQRAERALRWCCLMNDDAYIQTPWGLIEGCV